MKHTIGGIFYGSRLARHLQLLNQIGTQNLPYASAQPLSLFFIICANKLLMKCRDEIKSQIRQTC